MPTFFSKIKTILSGRPKPFIIVGALALAVCLSVYFLLPVYIAQNTIQTTGGFSQPETTDGEAEEWNPPSPPETYPSWTDDSSSTSDSYAGDGRDAVDEPTIKSDDTRTDDTLTDDTLTDDTRTDDTRTDDTRTDDTRTDDTLTDDTRTIEMAKPVRKSSPSLSSTDSNNGEADTSGGTRHRPPHQAQPLRAGETDDNKKWDAYLDYTRTYYGPTIHPTKLQNRTFIQFFHQDGTPAHDVEVSVTADDAEIFKGRTYPDGRIMFFPAHTGQNDMTVSIENQKSPSAHALTVNTGADNRMVLQSDAPVRPRQPLDVIFLLDSTGSMQDEINRIKKTLLSIASRVDDLPSNPETRFAMVSYRDRGDEYITRLYHFESDAATFRRTISRVNAAGGGDTPESLNQGLHTAITEAEWRPQGTVRIVFLIADAPPHLDYPQDHSYSTTMVTAREKAIKVHSVATSGLDTQGEYIFRQIAQQTMGKFIFLLYPDGPKGELTTPHNVGTDHQSESLDDLIVRLIKEELASLNPGMHHQPPSTTK